MRAFLAASRRRILGRQVAAFGLSLAGTGLAAGLLACLGCAAGAGPSALRWLVLAPAGGAAAGLLVFQLVLPWLRLRPDAALARLLEQRMGGDARRDLVSAVDFIGRLELSRALRAAGTSALQQRGRVDMGSRALRAAEGGPPDRAEGGAEPEHERGYSALQQRGRLLDGSSAALMEAHVERVARELSDLQLDRLLPARLHRIACLVGLAALLAAAVLATAPGACIGALRALVKAEPGPELAAADQPSWVGDIRLRYRYPAYSGREEREVEGSDGSILALPGTRVQLRARSDRPVRAGQLIGLAGGPVRLSVSAGRELAAELLVTAAGAYRFELESAAGERYRSAHSYPIQVEPDRPPAVELKEPAEDRVVREKDAIEVLYDARDDFGLDEIRLVWRVTGRPEAMQQRTLRRLAGKHQRSSRQRIRWELTELALVPGEQVQFYVEATDSDTVLGPKAGRSATVTLKVFSAEEHHRELMQRVGAFWEQMLVRLADHLDQSPEVRESTERLADHEALERGLAVLLEQLGSLQADLDSDRLAWPPLVEALDSIGRRLAGPHRDLVWLLERIRKRQGLADLETLSHQRTRRVERMERDVLFLEDLLDLERIEDLERIGQELAAARQRLAELMERYASSPTDEIRRQIEAEIARLKQQIARLVARQSEVLKGLRDEYVNPEALARLVEQRDMLGSLDRIQSLLNEGRLDEALAALGRLGEQMAGMQSAIQQARSGFGSSRYGELARKVADAQAELGQIAERQAQIAKATGQVRKKVLERLAKRLGGGRWEALRSRLQSKLKQVDELLRGMTRADLDAWSRRLQERAQEETRGLGELLEAGDLAESQQQAEALADDAARLQSSIEAIRRFDARHDPKRAGRLAQMHERARDAARLAREIQQDLHALMPGAGELLRRAEREKVGRLQAEQADLGRRLRSLRGQMQAIDGQIPIFGPPALDSMQRGLDAMRQAEQALRRADAPAAHPPQRAALSELEQLQRAMEESCKQCRSGGMPLPLGRSRSSGMGHLHSLHEKVEIPDADEYEAPEAFRKELLDGMKDPVPEQYEQQVRRYYEELVR
ncbi:MAG: DUF4175 family protein [Deltaproteobacteria bacterium]|nr:DUF4175 family protein [Deltaproteobacteria bacterium]